MTLSSSKTRALIASLLLVIVTNAIALGGVAYNRSGEPQSALTLSQRELLISRSDWLDHANSGIDLDLRWRMRSNDADPAYPGNRDLSWLDGAQQARLGFAPPAWAATGMDEGRSWDPPRRQAFVVLEYDGPAYRAAVERAREFLEHEGRLADANPGVKEFAGRLDAARHRLEREEKYASRLFVIDVDPSADVLRARYPDRSRYAIVGAHLDARLEREQLTFRNIVYIVRLDVETISVPHAFRAVVASALPDDQRYVSEDRAAPFEAKVEWGRRFEPWIAELRGR
jgi:hypothetical protein